jgi:hypothetical protein
MIGLEQAMNLRAYAIALSGLGSSQMGASCGASSHAAGRMTMRTVNARYSACDQQISL